MPAGPKNTKRRKKDSNTANAPPPNTSYKTFVLAGERYSIGDTMLIKAGKGLPDYVAKLEKIATDDKGEVHLSSRWYYRPEETAIGRQPWQGAEEVLESDHLDTCHVRCVNSKCSILTLGEYEALPLDCGTASKPIFFCRTFYQTDRKKIRETLPKYCVCKQPSNPDKLMIQCDKCDKWFHCACIGVAQSTASESEAWSCSVCSSSGKSA